MTSSGMAQRDLLIGEIEHAMSAGAAGADLVELVIRTGWQPRPTPDPDSDYLEGVLDSGRRVPIEIHHGVFSRLR